MKILVFIEGTVLMHKAALGVSRNERVKQSMDNEPSVNDFASYIPNGKAVEKINNWKQQGAEIHYLTSRTTPSEIAAIQRVLVKYKFPDQNNLLYRQPKQTYAQVAEDIKPDMLIEDDCESIGGEVEMTYPHIKPEIKHSIKSIVVKEFAGIDHLPDSIGKLKQPIASMPATVVLDIYSSLEKKGIKVWLDGGWGVDALLGRQTRSHEDVDIVIEEKDMTVVRNLFSERGYQNVKRDDTSSWNFVLGDNQGHLVDIHVVDFDPQGNGMYGPPERGVMYPAQSFGGKGKINKKFVRCLTAEYQLESHDGYKLKEKDFQDINELKKLLNRSD